MVKKCRIDRLKTSCYRCWLILLSDCCLLFVFAFVSSFVLWWPKTKDQRTKNQGLLSLFFWSFVFVFLVLGLWLGLLSSALILALILVFPGQNYSGKTILAPLLSSSLHLSCLVLVLYYGCLVLCCGCPVIVLVYSFLVIVLCRLVIVSSCLALSLFCGCPLYALLTPTLTITLTLLSQSDVKHTQKDRPIDGQLEESQVFLSFSVFLSVCHVCQLVCLLVLSCFCLPYFACLVCLLVSLVFLLIFCLWFVSL